MKEIIARWEWKGVRVTVTLRSAKVSRVRQSNRES